MTIRNDVLALLKDLRTVSYRASEELPFSNSGNPLYLKNPKKIYVDNELSSVEQLIPVMNGFNIDVEITSIKLYLCNDAKSIPNDYNQLIKDIKNIKNLVTDNDYFKREVSSDVSYENDIMLTTIEMRFTKIYQE